MTGALAPGRPARGVAAWLAACVTAVLVGATATVVWLLARESTGHAPFPASEWWVFLNLWRPLAIAGAVLVPVFAAPCALLAVWLIRRNNWPRPASDIAAGAVSGLIGVAGVVLAARALTGTMGDGQ